MGEGRTRSRVAHKVPKVDVIAAVCLSFRRGRERQNGLVLHLETATNEAEPKRMDRL